MLSPSDTPESRFSADPPLRILLVEPFFFFHSGEYLRAALTSHGYENARFTVLAGASDASAHERALHAAAPFPNLDLRVFEEHPSSRDTTPKSWMASGRALRLAEQTLKEESFDLLAYMHADFILPWFALPGAKRRFPGHFRMKIRGILFRDQGFRERAMPWGKKLAFQLEHAVFRRAIRSGAFERLAFLDPWSAEKARAEFGPICGYGVDPVDITPMDTAEARRMLGIPEDAYVALIFGGLSQRKGIFETLAALARAPGDLDRVVLVIAGPVDPPIREALEAAIEQTRKRCRVLYHEGFISTKTAAYFSSADCVICTYLNFYVSSNVLIHAAKCGKPLLVSTHGVMKDVIDKYRIGEAINPRDPAGFMAAFERLMRLSREERDALRLRAEAYAQTMDSRKFMAQFGPVPETLHPS